MICGGGGRDAFAASLRWPFRNKRLKTLSGNNMQCVKSVASGSIFVASMMAIAGCGSSGKPTADVSGSIKFSGKAPDLDGLRISFLAADGRPVVLDVGKD